MKYIQFYTMSIANIHTGPSHPIEMCGSDGIYILDGRLSLPNMLRTAYKIADTRRSICGFTIQSGRFSDSSTIHPYTSTNNKG